ncbi:tonB-system energizer ExbB [Brevundimonas nasdae]|uniref:tonB-system energizer ExbB n=1 Tax=Brevundimonas nasdae TaxID=172043 RepID=UPI0028A2609C|nr:tonB-system energizer ExbB [Brevundimonas nasdae]
MTRLTHLAVLTAASLLSAAPALGQETALDVAVALPGHDLTPWGMFMAADGVVKTVILGLALASVATWTVLVAKSLELKNCTHAQRAAFEAVDAARTLNEAAADERTARSPLMQAALAELALSSDALNDGEGLKERVASRFNRIEAALGRRMLRGTGALATIGATAPFVGLFGTVWGIMNSFIGIAASQTTNLAVVAPGIAEALLATAIGLVAAIPAVVIYNHFARQTAVYRALVSDTSAAILRLISRDLSRGVRG